MERYHSSGASVIGTVQSQADEMAANREEWRNFVENRGTNSTQQIKISTATREYELCMYVDKLQLGLCMNNIS